jgi:hypothetical protein
MTDQAQANGFDLDALVSAASSVTCDVDLIFNAQGDAVTGFRIVGKNSPEVQAAQERVRIDGIQRAGRRKVQLDTSTQEGAMLLANQIKDSETAVAMAAVVGWYGFTRAGEEVPFDKATVASMFQKFPTWRDKVIAALDNDGNFLKG